MNFRSCPQVPDPFITNRLELRVICVVYTEHVSMAGKYGGVLTNNESMDMTMYLWGFGHRQAQIFDTG